MAAASLGARGHAHLFFYSLEGKGARRVGVCSKRAQRGKWVFSELKNEPIFSIFIIPLPVYSHTAFLDDFFLRSFPYTQAEATPLWRTRGESSPLSKDTSRVGAQKVRASSGVCQTLVVCERGPYVPSPLNGAVPG